MTLIVDASVVVSALTDVGAAGAWAESLLESGSLVAPHLLPVEAANVLRRAVLGGDISGDTASLAHADLIELDIVLFPYRPFAERVWELRGKVSAYDAWYVAMAEALDAPLATLDRKLQGATGSRCHFLLPPGV